MAKMIFLDTRAFVSGADLSGYSNRLEVNWSSEVKETTNFRSGGAKERVASIGDTEISGGGQFEEGDATKPGDSFWANRRVIEPWSVAPAGDSDLAAGGLMYLTSALRTNMKLLGEVGDVSPWEVSASGSQPLTRGKVVHASGVPRTATGTGTVVDMLAGPTASQVVYANLHLLSVAAGGGTLTVTVQSATTIGFSSPTTRGTFTAATAVGGQALKIASPGTDRYWRLSWTVSGGTSPSFLFLASLGIE